MQEIEAQRDFIIDYLNQDRCTIFQSIKSYEKQEVHYQEMFLCMTCFSIDAKVTRHALCVYCANVCHADHATVSLYFRRNIICECSLNKSESKCKCVPDLQSNILKNGVELPQVELNHNQEYRFCKCRFSENNINFSSIQCINCQDWQCDNCVPNIKEFLNDKSNDDQTQDADFICDDCLNGSKLLRNIAIFSKLIQQDVTSIKDQDIIDYGMIEQEINSIQEILEIVHKGGHQHLNDIKDFHLFNNDQDNFFVLTKDLCKCANCQELMYIKKLNYLYHIFNMDMYLQDDLAKLMLSPTEIIRLIEEFKKKLNWDIEDNEPTTMKDMKDRMNTQIQLKSTQEAQIKSRYAKFIGDDEQKINMAIKRKIVEKQTQKMIDQMKENYPDVTEYGKEHVEGFNKQQAENSDKFKDDEIELKSWILNVKNLV